MSAYSTNAITGDNDFPKKFTVEELRERLTKQQFSVTQKSGTERAFTGEYWNNHRKGIYKCVVCEQDIFSSDKKFESGSGWPSFYDVIDKNKVKLISDKSLFMNRVEVVCSQCGSHLGHIFDDGPAPTENKLKIRMVDYKKWDHIEVSDDEDETHPNIDTPSLFKWRHEARIQKMETLQSKKDNLKKKMDETKEKKKVTLSNLNKAKKEKDTEQVKKLEKSLKDLVVQEEKIQDEKTYLMKEENTMPLNVDTLSQPGFSKTIINNPKAKKEELSEDEKYEQSKIFMDKYKDDIKKYGMLHEYHDSEEMLTKKPYLACEDTANYLVVWCIDLEVEEKHALMERVAHQTICMQFLLELAKQLDMDPRSTVKGFFQKMRKADASYDKGFQDELSSFIVRVKERAQARIDKAMKEYEEEEREKRLGPGGLDPVEVFESLPKVLQECFESKDIEKLKKSMTDLPQEEAQYHLERCVASGLWIPDANKDAKESGDTETIEDVE